MAKDNLDVRVFLCDCGGSISRVIDFDRLSEFASGLEGVKLVKRHGFLCGEEGGRQIGEAIRDGAERIVIAACSPKLFERHFRQLSEEMGLNPYFLEMANIREQCAWPPRKQSSRRERKSQESCCGCR